MLDDNKDKEIYLFKGILDDAWSLKQVPCLVRLFLGKIELEYTLDNQTKTKFLKQYKLNDIENLSYSIRTETSGWLFFKAKRDYLSFFCNKQNLFPEILIDANDSKLIEDFTHELDKALLCLRAKEKKKRERLAREEKERLEEEERRRLEKEERKRLKEEEKERIEKERLARKEMERLEKKERALERKRIEEEIEREESERRKEEAKLKRKKTIERKKREIEKKELAELKQKETIERKKREHEEKTKKQKKSVLSLLEKLGKEKAVNSNKKYGIKFDLEDRILDYLRELVDDTLPKGFYVSDDDMDEVLRKFERFLFALNRFDPCPFFRSSKIEIEIQHNILEKSKVIKGEKSDVQKKALILLEKWDLEYKRVSNIEKQKKLLADNLELAQKKTEEAELSILHARKILSDSLTIDFSDNYLKKYKAIKGNIQKTEDYFQLILKKSDYPFQFKKELDTSFINESQILIVNYQLPLLSDIPNVKAVKYLKSNDIFQEVIFSDKLRNETYEDILYQMVLRSINEVYTGDFDEVVKSVVFNGWIESVNDATGKDMKICILSCQANRDDFLDINLSGIQPRSCFRFLKGVGSPKLTNLAAVAPIIDLQKDDKRFVSHYDVADGLNESLNIAAMDWQDFEHLIREIFEKEFSTNGGEVKVTQSSRDGGVDAIAFDPDPLRGGKIVIQAKRYTNIVGISAVRDLYGTLINEGATRGILVTTSDYGADSYKFAKGKPLTLLNGSNLLHILEKHGYKAKIDLKEAKKRMSVIS